MPSSADPNLGQDLPLQLRLAGALVGESSANLSFAEPFAAWKLVGSGSPMDFDLFGYTGSLRRTTFVFCCSWPLYSFVNGNRIYNRNILLVMPVIAPDGAPDRFETQVNCISTVGYGQCTTAELASREVTTGTGIQVGIKVEDLESR